jgi:hypothetical protein
MQPAHQWKTFKVAVSQDHLPWATDYLSASFQCYPKFCEDITNSGCSTGVVDTGGKCEKVFTESFYVLYYGNFGQQVTMIDLYFFLLFNLRCNQSDIAVIVIICVNHTAAELL